MKRPDDVWTVLMQLMEVVFCLMVLFAGGLALGRAVTEGQWLICAVVLVVISVGVYLLGEALRDMGGDR